jgi:alkaline phosphatase
MMHVLDYDRALGELLELDDTVQKTIARALRWLSCQDFWTLINPFIDLKEIGEYENTLIVVTADHGHGFVRSFTKDLPIFRVPLNSHR